MPVQSGSGFLPASPINDFVLVRGVNEVWRGRVMRLVARLALAVAVAATALACSSAVGDARAMGTGELIRRPCSHIV